MSHPLQRKIRSVGRRARLCALLCGFGQIVTWSAVAILLIGCIDYLFVVRDVGVRMIGSMTVLLVIVWTARQFYRRFSTTAWSELDLAQRIEKYFPSFNDRLSSSISFLRQHENDATAGSAELRRAVIVQTHSDFQQLNLREVINYRPVVRAAASVCLTVLVAGIFVLVTPVTTTRALRRMAVPWSSERWNQLTVQESPDRIVKGDDFTVRAVDRRGDLPRFVHVRYWFEGDSESMVLEEPMIRDRDSGAVHHLANVSRSFRFRVVGGDDESMPWKSVEVVEPPTIASFDVRVIPPEYTGWPPSTAQPPIRLLEGSLIEVRGVTTTPVVSAKVRVETPDAVAAYNVKLSKNNCAFSVNQEHDQPWVVDQSCSFWFELVGPAGVIGGRERLYEIEVWPHLAPRVSIREPVEHQRVTPQAVVSVVADVQDDVAIDWVQLRVLSDDGNRQNEATIEMYRGADASPGESTHSNQSPSVSADRREFDYAWDLSKLNQITPGTKLSILVEAANFKPAVGQSDRQRVTIISADDLLDRVAQRQRSILNQIAETLRQQQVARAQNQQLEIQMREVGLLRDVDFDHLRKLNFSQNEVGRLVLAEGNGLLAHASSVIGELRRNRIEESQIEVNLTRFRESLQTVTQEHLEPIEEQLVLALKNSRVLKQHPKAPEAAAQDAAEGVRQSLHDVARQQDAVIARLKILHDEFSDWETYHQFAFDIRQLIHDQEQVSQQTNKLRWRSVSKSRVSFSAQDRADYRKVSREQNHLAHQLDRIQARMDDGLNESTDSEPTSRHTIADALECAVRHTVSSSMRDADRAIDAGQVGQASIMQQQIQEHLEEMLQILTHRDEHDAERLVNKLRQAADDLAEVSREHKELRKQLETPANSTNALGPSGLAESWTAHARTLREKISRLSRKLDRLRAQRAARSLDRASSQMQDAAEANFEQRFDDALVDARNAEADLDSARQELEASIQRAEQGSINEAVAELEDRLKKVLDRQIGVCAEIRRLDQVRRDEGRSTDGQRDGMATVRKDQREVADEIDKLAVGLRNSAIFHLALTRAGEPTREVVSRLEHDSTDRATQELAELAATRLKQLHEAIQEEGDSAEEEGEGGDAAEGGGSGGAGGQDTAGIAQLKLLKLMQDEVNVVTHELEQRRLAHGALDESDRARIVQLAEQQYRLADLILSMFQPEEGSNEGLPELVPDADTGDNDDWDRDLDKLLR